MSSLELLLVNNRRRTPYVQQSETSECGLACLAMVCGHFGLNIDMPSLRRQFGLSLKGTSLKGLIQISEKIGLQARALRGELVDLTRIGTPVILHWDMNHFVVLAKVSHRFGKTEFRIHDPARAARTYSRDEISKRFSGVILELTPSERFQGGEQRSKIRITQLWSRMSGFWTSLQQVLLLSLVLQLIALASPFYLQLAVDTAFPDSDKDLLGMLALGFGGLAVINVLTTWLRSVVLVILSNSLSYQVMVNLYRHLLRLPLSWFDKRHVGDIVSRFGSTKPIADLLSQGLISALIDGLMAFVTLALMVVYSPLLAGIAFVAWVLFAAVKFSFVHALRLNNVGSIVANARENTNFIESVRGISPIKAFGQESNRQNIWQGLKADAVNAQIRLGKLNSGFDAVGQLILAVERVLFIYVAIRLGMSGIFTVGMIFAFQSYKQQFLDSATRLIDHAINYRLLDVHLTRIADIALSSAELPAGGSHDFDSVSGRIELQSVGFRYGTGEADVLRNVNFVVEPGEMVAFVGPSGGGKTTLLKIMMGLFEPLVGRVVIDGVPLSTARVGAWRRHVGSVSQDDSLFAGTLAENIAFFDPEIDMGRVVEVAGLAAIHDEIVAMPMGYETLVGDMGSVLSGGQKQRVLLARALYPRPSVLFIDEGTAQLDIPSEAKIVEALKSLPITRIVSAHRPTPIAAASKLFLVAEGVVTLLQRHDAPLADNRASENA